jgi:CheY-like chemotaxis protein
MSDQRKLLESEDLHPLRVIYTVGFLAATGGAVIALAYALLDSGRTPVDGIAWTVYMLATASVAGVLGLLFGLPRTRTGYSAESSERFTTSSALEQVSDWLTKILVGAGLVELTKLPRAIGTLGGYLGKGMTVPNPSAFATTAVVYGAGLGFSTAYLWSRLRLRLLLEAEEREATEVSLGELITSRLQITAGGSGVITETRATLRRAVESALAATAVTDARHAPILWIDDYPVNNASIIQSFHDLSIDVDTALSTESGLQMAKARDYGLVISDLSRFEGGCEDRLAGLHLTQRLREGGNPVPVIIFATKRASQYRQQLEEAGAALVTNRASELIERASQIVSSVRTNPPTASGAAARAEPQPSASPGPRVT